jgi:hypothetical protein
MADSEDDIGEGWRIARPYPPHPPGIAGNRGALITAMKLVLPALAVPLFLSACVPPDPPQSATLQSTSTPRYATYRCDGDGEITLENFRTSVHVVDTRGVDVELPASPPNQTARYGEPGYALILERGTALWMVSGKRPVNCKRESDPA